MIDLTDRMVFRLGNLNTEQTRISYQMSTGKLLERGSDDSSVFARELYVNDKIRTYEGLQTQIEKTTAQNNVSDSSIDEMKKLLDNIKQDMLKALNAGMDPADKKATAVNMQGVKENLLTLANERVSGEYLFTGSDSTIRPFTKDAITGVVTYNGDALDRKIAVEPNSYRDRGVTGLDILFYNASETGSSGSLDFFESEKIIDESGLEWMKPYSTAGNKMTFDAADTLVDDSATGTWTLNSATSQLENGAFTIDVVNIEGDKWQTVDTIDLSTGSGGSLTSLAISTPVAAASQIRQVSSSGILTSNTLAITSAIPPASGVPYTTAAITTATGYTSGDSLTSKHSIFEEIDIIINSLDTDDDTTLRASLDRIDESYDATNIAHSKLGGRNKIFLLAQDTVSSKLTHFNILMQEVSGADLSKVAMEAKALEMTYTALYSTITKMNNLSLVNFIR